MPVSSVVSLTCSRAELTQHKAYQPSPAKGDFLTLVAILIELGSGYDISLTWKKKEGNGGLLIDLLIFGSPIFWFLDWRYFRCANASF